MKCCILVKALRMNLQEREVLRKCHVARLVDRTIGESKKEMLLECTTFARNVQKDFTTWSWKKPNNSLMYTQKNIRLKVQNVGEKASQYLSTVKSV